MGLLVDLIVIRVRCGSDCGKVCVLIVSGACVCQAKAKVPPLNHGPLRETRCMKQRPRAVTMTHAPAQRNSQDMDATGPLSVLPTFGFAICLRCCRRLRGSASLLRFVLVGVRDRDSRLCVGWAERYLARARDCSLIRSSEGVAASSPRAGVSPKLTPGLMQRFLAQSLVMIRT